MKHALALRCTALTLVASLALAGGGACEEKAPPPVPGGGGSQGGGNPDPARAARQVRDMVNNTKGAIEDNQQKAVDAANDISAGTGSQAGKGFGLAGVEFTLQPGWTAQGASGMRKADLLYKGSSGEVHAVFFTLGGSADDNFNRWERQVEPDSGEQAKRTSQEVNGLTVRKLDVRGTYSGMTADNVTSPATPNMRFIGVVIEGGRGPIQIRLVGPQQVVNEAAPSFEAMLAALRKS